MFLIKLLDFLNKEMPTPLPYSSFQVSWFHYLSLVFYIGLAALLIIKSKNFSNKKIENILLFISILLMVFEVYKQIIFSYDNNWQYPWYIFPFQFCSVPMYLMFLVKFVKNEKIKQSIITFLATYALFAGTAVMFYPGDVFVTTIGINIQTMLHHGLIMVVGLVLLSKYSNKTFANYFGSMVVFLIILIIAMLLNTIHNTWIKDGTFNMFFINPKFTSHIPVLVDIQPKVSSFMFVVIYYLGFSLLSLLLYLINMTLYKLKNKNILKLSTI